MYQALYRKWRSQTFSDVVGQDHITTTLKNQVSAGKPSHAYLFCGTRGTGKTSCSKILAKAVNCLNPRDGDPCGVCDICRGIDDGSILDVMEIDAASNSGVDNIRDLREEAFYTPSVCRYRVYIIDETHMLSAGAFNALLKIMEEPPAHVLFILATTEIHKVPATILSRCQRFDFRRIPVDIIAARLLHIAQGEDFILEAEAAEMIARLADGGMRDAISLLDLCVSGTDAVTVQVVKDSAGLIDQEYLFAIARALMAQNPESLFAVLEGQARSMEYQRLCEQLIGFYRNLMVARSVPDPGEFIACLPEELTQYKEMAQAVSMDYVLNCLDVLQETLMKMSRVSARRMELEMALLRLCAADSTVAATQATAAPPKNEHPATAAPAAAVSALLARLEKLEKQLAQAPAAGYGGPIADKPREAETEKPDPLPDSEEIRKTPVTLFPDWDKVLARLKTKNNALLGALAGSTAYTGGDLFLVDGGVLFASLVRSDSYAKETLRDAIVQVTGKKYRLGPYNADQYEISSNAPDSLDELLGRAGELGVPMQVKE